MTDAVNIATLKDNKTKIESILERIKKNLQKWDVLEPSEQTRVINTIYSDFKYIDVIINEMKAEVRLVKNEQTEKAFKDHITTLKAETKRLQDEFTEKQNQKKDLGLLVDDIKLKDKPLTEMNILELKGKGDNILKEDGEAINRIDLKVKNQLDIANEIKKDLNNQNQKLDNVQKDLKEMDYSLARARKHMTQMFKMYATDKLIMCMIVIIVLVILAIIITAAVGGDKNKNFNVPHDIFTSNTTSTTSSRILFLNNNY
jgi:hypothetical protein